MFVRTVNDVKVLEICEVPPIRRKSWEKGLSEKFTKLCIKMPWSFLNVSTTLQERKGNYLLLLKSSMVGVSVFI